MMTPATENCPYWKFVRLVFCTQLVLRSPSFDLFVHRRFFLWNPDPTLFAFVVLVFGRNKYAALYL
jgi:hypothetical protein